ncbi:MAG TPA: hypothetical protein VEJ63_14100 [Planctomycetota bacterium]|nr:hypothetical protein [Planctomycetota bacterium]
MIFVSPPMLFRRFARLFVFDTMSPSLAHLLRRSLCSGSACDFRAFFFSHPSRFDLAELSKRIQNLRILDFHGSSLNSRFLISPILFRWSGHFQPPNTHAAGNTASMCGS